MGSGSPEEDKIKAVITSKDTGTCTVTVIDWGEKKLAEGGDPNIYKEDTSYKITATAVYNGVERSVHTLIERGTAFSPFSGVLTLTGLENQSIQFGNSSQTNPLEGDVFISRKPGAGSVSIGVLNVRGNVFIKGDAKFTDTFRVMAAADPGGKPHNGALFVEGNIIGQWGNIIADEATYASGNINNVNVSGPKHPGIYLTTMDLTLTKHNMKISLIPKWIFTIRRQIRLLTQQIHL